MATGGVNVDKFAQQLQDVCQCTLTLNQRLNISPLVEKDLQVKAFEELRVALEKLRLAQEQMYEQNQILAQTYASLEAQRRRYVELFDFAPEAYLVTNSHGDILLANRAASNLFKISPQFLKGKPLIEFVPEAERGSFCLQILQLQQIEQLHEWEIGLQNSQGVKFDASISVVTSSEGNQVGCHWLVRDVTSRKQAEEKIRSMEMENLRLQETTQMKSQFMAMVSHELRTPMNIILGFAQLLLRQPCYQLPGPSKMMIERIFNNGKRLLKLIEDILDFSSLTTSQLNLMPSKFNLTELIIKTVEELRPLAQQKNLFLNLNLKLENPIIINDRDRLQQILANLLDNAIKFTQKGSVCLEVKEINQDRIAFTIKDTGIGIAQVDLKYIFQEFRQVDQSITRKQGGTGLGLAIVDKLLRLMKGTITVESDLGEGSTFSVELPRKVR